jgi:arabinose-5-phosphate isomerase
LIDRNPLEASLQDGQLTLRPLMHKIFPSNSTATDWREIARAVIEDEARVLATVAARLDHHWNAAVEVLLNHKGKVIVSGIGKSGHVGQKIAATLASTGTPAVFLHAAEAVHGDLGIYTPGDPSILISKSGSTAELLRLIPILRQFRSPLIAIVGNLNSPMAKQADVVLDARVDREADPLNLAPTCSTTAALALGDALAVVLMQARSFTDKDFARYHPAGQLGRNLWLKVADVMHQDEAPGNYCHVRTPPGRSVRCESGSSAPGDNYRWRPAASSPYP